MFEIGSKVRFYNCQEEINYFRVLDSYVREGIRWYCLANDLEEDYPLVSQDRLLIYNSPNTTKSKGYRVDAGPKTM
jgi:hypothetical protein